MYFTSNESVNKSPLPSTVKTIIAKTVSELCTVHNTNDFMQFGGVFYIESIDDWNNIFVTFSTLKESAEIVSRFSIGYGTLCRATYVSNNEYAIDIFAFESSTPSYILSDWNANSVN